MVHEVIQNGLIKTLRNSAKEIGYKTLGAYAFLGLFAIVITITFVLSQQRQNVIQRASGGIDPYTYTFDGDPPTPESKYWMDDFDVQVHSGGPEYERRDNLFDTMQAAHGSDCGPPPASHTINTAQTSVFNCKNHVMTSISGGYALIYLQPNRMLDWSDGEAEFSFDISTFRTSGRDWWDMWLTEWDKQATSPLGDRFGQAGVALNGPPIGDYFHIQLMEQNFFRAESESGEIDRENTGFSNSSATQRDKFVLTIRKNGTFDFCKPDENVCFFKDRPHGLSVTQAVIQVGHHTYDPAKSCNIPDCHDDTDTAWKAFGTWHWDNLHLSDSIPYTIIRGDKRSIGQPWYGNSDAERTVAFPAPAPANSFLKFETAAQDTRVNGVPVQPIIPYWSDHYTSYFVPVPEGTTSVVLSSQAGCPTSCLWRSFSIVSKTLIGESTPPSPTIIQNTPTPLPPVTATPTNIPQPTATGTPIPTNTPIPLPTATNTPIPQPTATNTPPPQATPTPTKTPAQRADFNNSGTVDIQDLSYLLSRWNTNDLTADISGDGSVGIVDLSILLSNWGK